MQRVLNLSAGLVSCELHWLPVGSCIEFKVLKGQAFLYLSELISVLPPSSYNLRRNYNGTLLCTPKFKATRTYNQSIITPIYVPEFYRVIVVTVVFISVYIQCSEVKKEALVLL